MTDASGSPLYLAVDAGNTKTDAVVLDGVGRVRGYGRARCGDIYVDADVAVDEVTRAVEQAGDAPVERLRFAGVALRLAGVDWPEDAEYWRDVVRDRWGWDAAPSVLNDGFAGLRFGRDDGRGVNVTVGTGSAIAGRGPGGAEWGLNEWGQHSMGADGIGKAAMRAIGLAELGMGPATALTEAFATHFGVPDGAALIHARRSRHPSVPDRELTAAAPLVTAAAGAGDPVARQIVERQAQLLARYAGMVATRVGFDVAAQFTLVLAGSVVRGDQAPMRAAILREFASALPGAEVVVVDEPPVLGAALDVIAEAGIGLSPEIRSEVHRSFAAASSALR